LASIGGGQLAGQPGAYLVARARPIPVDRGRGAGDRVQRVSGRDNPNARPLFSWVQSRATKPTPRWRKARIAYWLPSVHSLTKQLFLTSVRVRCIGWPRHCGTRADQMPRPFKGCGDLAAEQRWRPIRRSCHAEGPAAPDCL
jgi:hypothetical protein